jgi:hypothetical protein
MDPASKAGGGSVEELLPVRVFVSTKFVGWLDGCVECIAEEAHSSGQPF